MAKTAAPVKTQRLDADAAEVWDFLVERGGLQVSDYDQGIVEALGTFLGFDPIVPFKRQLKSARVPVEDFINAFFRAIEPYAMMMSDLLAMFERAGAQSTRENLEVGFDFAKSANDLRFDLRSFRKWIERWRQVTRPVTVERWDTGLLWELRQAFEAVPGQQWSPDADVARWLREYSEDRCWPESDVSGPDCDHPLASDLMRRVWKVWSGVVTASKQFGADRETLRRIAFGGDEESARLRTETANVHSLLDPRVLGQLDSDGWAGSLLGVAYSWASRLSQTDYDDAAALASALHERLEAVFARVPNDRRDLNAAVLEFEELLNLPLWKRRHELYSAWVSTQLVDALGREAVRIHEDDGVILFSFSGTHLATTDGYALPLHVWAELRSPLGNPVGRGRVRSIQPDYSVALEPVTAPGACVIAVECKQYLKASAKNFAAALADYSRGRPNAQVILVNYAAAPRRILDQVAAELRDRAHLIGNMRPGCSAALSEFRDLVLAAVTQRLATARSKGPRATIIEEMVTLTLSWNDRPLDLDLHAVVQLPGTTHHVHYGNLGCLDHVPFACLDHDVRSGRGPETLSIKPVKGDGHRYTFAVHNYSDEVPVAGCGATVDVTGLGAHIKLLCPVTGSGTWWHLLEIDTGSQAVNIINQVAQSIPDIPG